MSSRLLSSATRVLAVVSVIAGTGIVGFALWYRSCMPPAQPPLWLVLHTANTVFIGPADFARGRPIPSVTLCPAGETDDVDHIERSKMLDLLRQSDRFHEKPASNGTYFIQIAKGMDSPLYTYRYDPISGELGSGSDWCIVPPAFRDWARSAIAAR